MRSFYQTLWDIRHCHFIGVLFCSLAIRSSTARSDSPTDRQPKVLRNSIEMEFIYCPPGRFLMGSPESDPDARPAEKPQTVVEISRGRCVCQLVRLSGVLHTLVKT